MLAGGKSTRMNSDKPLLRLAGHPLLEIATRKALAVSDAVFIVGPRSKFGPEAIEDVFPDCGPLGGIHAALAGSRAELNLMLAVDLPFMEIEFLRYLRREAELSYAIVTVPRMDSGWQPLCAIYRSGFLNSAEEALRAGHNKIDALFNQLPLRIVDQAELQKAGFTPAMFDNLNTPEDLARAERRLVKG